MTELNQEQIIGCKRCDKDFRMSIIQHLCGWGCPDCTKAPEPWDVAVNFLEHAVMCRFKEYKNDPKPHIDVWAWEVVLTFDHEYGLPNEIVLDTTKDLLPQLDQALEMDIFRFHHTFDSEIPIEMTSQETFKANFWADLGGDTQPLNGITDFAQVQEFIERYGDDLRGWGLMLHADITRGELCGHEITNGVFKFHEPEGCCVTYFHWSQLEIVDHWPENMQHWPGSRPREEMN